MLAAINYTEPPFYVVLLGTAGLIALIVFSGWLRRVVLGMFGGGLGAAAIAWYVLGKGGGELVGLMQLIGTPACGVLAAIVCAFAGFFGKWVGRNPRP